MKMGDEKPQNKKSKKSWWKTLSGLSVEPAGFLVIMSVVVSHLIFQNLMMETICRVDLGYEEETCKEIINKVNVTYKAQEREIQKVAAGVQAITSVIMSVVTIFVVLFIGPWSDANGRKVPLLISVGGLVIYSMTMVLCYLSLGKLKAIQLALLAMLPVLLSGGGTVFAMSAYSYISDTTKSKNRTVRTGIMSASVRSGTPVGFAIGGALNRLGVGIMPSLFVCIGLSVIAFLLVLFKVKNVIPAEMEKTEEEKEAYRKRKKKSKWVRYNPLTKLIQAFAIMFKPRPDKWTFYLLVLCHVCYAAPGSGEYSMLYLFVRERLQWNVSDYGFFSMYNWLMSAGGVFLSMFVLSKKLKISDPIVGFVSGISQIGGSTFYAFASSAAMMYCASGLDMMNGTIGVVVRSMLSKIVRSDEVGKLFALLGVIESCLPLLMVPTYAMVYRTTVTKFAGAFFFLSAGITLPAELIFLYFMVSKKKRSFEQNHEAVDNKNHPAHVIDEVEAQFDPSNFKGPEAVKLMPHELLEKLSDDEESDEGEEDSMKDQKLSNGILIN